METIADKLNHLLNSKNAIKQALTEQGKEPTDALDTYASLVDGLENPEQVTYCVTVDGESKAYATIYGEERANLTATANDIRKDTVAITNNGVTTGEKDIPAYYSTYGSKLISPGKRVTINKDEYAYKSLMATIATYDKSISSSLFVTISSINDAIYECNSNTKLADITIDYDNEQIDFGITVTEKSVLRYFVVREEE